jgi:CDGSH-type Zn-finger protein
MNKRKYERFDIELPARLETIVLKKKQVFDLVTKNISASGAYLSTNSPFSDGLHIKMSLTTQNKKIAELTGARCLIECEGRIVRTTQTGAAVCFDKECQIMSLKGP